MIDSSLILPIVSAGVAGVFCVLFILGWIYPRSVVTDLKEENRLLRDQLANERARGDAAVAAAQGTRDLMEALRTGIHMGARKP